MNVGSVNQGEGLMPYLNKASYSLYIIMREDECWYRKSWGVNAIS